MNTQLCYNKINFVIISRKIDLLIFYVVDASTI